MLADDVAGQERHFACEDVAIEFAEVGHLGGVGDSFLVDPFHDLLGAEGLHAAIFAPGGEGLGGLLEEVGLQVGFSGRGWLLGC